MFLQDIQQFFEDFTSHIEWIKPGSRGTLPIAGLFRHVREFQNLSKALTKSQKIDFFYRNGAKSLARSIEIALASLPRPKKRQQLPIPVLANYVASGVVELLRWWVEHNMPYSPERMDEVFHELIMPGFRDAFDQYDARSLALGSIG